MPLYYTLLKETNIKITKNISEYPTSCPIFKFRALLSTERNARNSVWSGLKEVAQCVHHFYVASNCIVCKQFVQYTKLHSVLHYLYSAPNCIVYCTTCIVYQIRLSSSTWGKEEKFVYQFSDGRFEEREYLVDEHGKIILKWNFLIVPLAKFRDHW